MCVCVQCVQWLGQLHLSSFASKRKEKKVFHIIIFVSISDFIFTAVSILDHLDEYLSCPLGQAAKHTKRSYQDLLISFSVETWWYLPWIDSLATLKCMSKYPWAGY